MIEAPAERLPVERHLADWNVVVTVAEQGFRDAVRLLRKWGRVKRTAYYNVLGMTVERPDAFLAAFAAAVAESPGILNSISHVIPAQHAFDFATEEEFEARARAVALAWVTAARRQKLSRAVASARPQRRAVDAA